ncbi:MAG: XrtA system polysaccharide deacetylase [bacterium]
MHNVFTVDVEDYYMVTAFKDIVKYKDWPTYQSRVEDNTKKILELLAANKITATFFVLGWVAKRYPSLVREIQSEGHEIASHGYNHRLIYEMTPDEFREDVHKSKSILEDITGGQIKGYRAASYSIVQATLWALDILIEEGFLYDSSIFPIRHDLYGLPDANRFHHIIERNGGKLHEFPATTSRILGQNLPIAGGGYLRLFPLSATKAVVRRVNRKERKPVIFYVHPWEVDVDQPRLNGRLLSKARHYLNLKSTMPKLAALLGEFKFVPLSGLLVGSEKKEKADKIA